MKHIDTFTMNENTVNEAVWNFLISVGCSCPSPKTGKERGIDVQGEKNGWTIYVESKGTKPNKPNKSNKTGKDFESAYIRKYINSQIGKLMKHQNKYEGKCLFVMSNHDTAYTREHVNNVIKSTNMLGFIQFWVQDDMSVQVENPEHLDETLISLGIKKINSKS